MGIWANILIKDLDPISHISQNSSMIHMQVSVSTERNSCPNYGSNTFETAPFRNVGLVVSGTFSFQNSRHLELLSRVNLDPPVYTKEFN